MPKVKIKKHYHRKLVRDRIPEIIESKGDLHKAKVLNIRKYRKLLRKKLVEEAKELENVRKTDLIKELADILQVLKSIAEFEKVPFKKIEDKRKQRKRERGGFRKKIFLVWSNKPAGEK